MTLKKKAHVSKRANLPRAADYTKSFRKDWERLSRTGRFDMSRLKKVMLHLIANDAPLPPQYKDHALKGDWKDYQECHIGGDFLLIYQADGNRVVFVRCGTHSELFD